MGSRRIQQSLSRRRFLAGSAAAAGAVLLSACGDDGGPDPRGGGRGGTEAAGGRLPPTPSCDDGEPTPEQTEGPFYTPDTPRRADIRAAGVAGAPLLLAGRVLDTDCRPIAGALLDFWQADGEGEYDNEGFRLRGHQFADRRGRFALATVVPGRYTGRTPHIHVKVQRRGGDVLTTQLYLAGEAGNAEDPLFDEALVVDLRRGSGRRRASFDFVLEA